MTSISPAVRKAIEELIWAARILAYEGVLDAFGHVSVRHPEDPTRFMLYETWEDHDEVLAVQLHRPYRHAWHAALPELLATPRDISIWQPLRADRRQAPRGGSSPAPEI